MGNKLHQTQSLNRSLKKERWLREGSWLAVVVIMIGLSFVIEATLPSQRDFYILISAGILVSIAVFTTLRLQVRKANRKTSEELTTLEEESIEFKRALQRLEKEASHLRKLLCEVVENLKVGVIFLDNDEKVMVLNKQMEKTFSLKHEETVGHRLEELMPELEKGGFEKKVLKWTSELKEKEKDEKEFEIEDAMKRTHLYTIHIYRNDNTVLGTSIFVEDTTERNRMVEQSVRSDKALSRTTRRLEEKLEELTRQYESARKGYLDTVRAFAFTLEARNQYTREHSERVTNYALDIARKMNLEQETLELIQYAGRLHDIGKIAIKDEILTKPGGLSVTEFAEIRLHPTKGAEILEPLGFLKESLDSIRYHHERFDGGGYPDRLSKDKIPLTARILAVADTFDAMTSDRPYRKAFSVEQAVEELKRNSGTQFDPHVVQAFMQILNYRKK